MEERARIEGIRNLYVYASQGQQKVPLSSVSRTAFAQETTRFQRGNQFRTITVAMFPADGYLASDVMKLAEPGLASIRRPAIGWRMVVSRKSNRRGSQNWRWSCSSATRPSLWWSLRRYRMGLSAHSQCCGL